MDTKALRQKVLDLGILPFLEEQQRLGRIKKLGFSFHAPYGVFKRIIDLSITVL